MPSSLHQTVIDLLRRAPDLVPQPTADEADRIVACSEITTLDQAIGATSVAEALR